MWQHLRTSLIVLVGMTLLTGGVYPLVVTLFSQTLFPGPANGSLVVRDGRPVGSDLIGQPFSKPEYFWGRLSATSPVPYNAASSSGSNFGPRHPDLAKNAKERIDALRSADPGIDAVPVDLVTASGSGLDPHLSPSAAEVQIWRVAAARKIAVEEVRRLVAVHTEGRQFGVLGEPRVNVLALNLALDARAQKASEP
jgi:potassium-transporting ATPase KdpC subunit